MASPSRNKVGILKSNFTEIDLCFRSRLHLHPHERNRLNLPHVSNESFYSLVTTGETVLGNQVLINASSAQAGCQRRFNDRSVGFAKTLTNRRSKWLVLNLDQVRNRGSKWLVLAGPAADTGLLSRG